MRRQAEKRNSVNRKKYVTVRDDTAAHSGVDDLHDCCGSGSFKKYIGNHSGLAEDLIDKWIDGGFFVHQGEGLMPESGQRDDRIFSGVIYNGFLTGRMKGRYCQQELFITDQIVVIIASLLICQCYKSNVKVTAGDQLLLFTYIGFDHVNYDIRIFPVKIWSYMWKIWNLRR